MRATPPKLSVTRRNKARRRTKPIPERRPSPDTAGQPQKPITRAISLGVRRSAIAKNVPKIKSSVTKQRAFVVATLPPSRLLDSDDVSRSMERASTEKGTLIKSGYPEPMEMKQAAPNTEGSDEATKPEHADTGPDSDLLQIDSDDSVPSIDDDDLLGDWPELESDHLLSPKKDPAFGKKAGASLSGDIEAVVSSTVESADPEEKDSDTFLDGGEDFAPDDLSNRGPTPRTSSDSLEGRTGRDKRRTRAHSKGIEVADGFEDPAELASRVKEGLASEVFHKKEKSTKPHGASRKTGSKVLNHSTGHRQRKESAEQKTGEDDGVERKTSDANGKKSDPWDSSLEEDEGITLGKKGLEDDLLDDEDEEAKGLEGGKRRKEGAKDDEDADETGEDEKDHTEGTKTQQPAEKKNPSQDHNDSSLKALGLTSAKLEADEGTTASAKTKHATEDLSKHRNPPGEKAGRDQKSPSEKKGKLRHWNVSRLKGKGHGMGSGHKREFALRRQEKAIQAKVLRNKLKEVEDTGSDIINDNFGAALTAPTPEAPPQQAAPSTLATETAAASASWARASDNGVGGDAGLARLLAIVFGFTGKRRDRGRVPKECTDCIVSGIHHLVPGRLLDMHTDLSAQTRKASSAHGSSHREIC